MKKILAGLFLSMFFLAACDSSGEFKNDKIGRVWRVQEGSWAGTWTRRENSPIFDAVWTGPGGEQMKDVISTESFSEKEVVLYRQGMKGRYRGKLSADGTKVEDGHADWYPAGLVWTATIKK